MIRSATDEAPQFVIRLAPLLAFCLLAENFGTAQDYRIETLLGDFDPLEEVSLVEAWVLSPNVLAVDSDGSLYFVDGDTYRVRKVDPSRPVSTIAGNGLVGYSGDDGPATEAARSEPWAAADSVGSLSCRRLR